MEETIKNHKEMFEKVCSRCGFCGEAAEPVFCFLTYCHSEEDFERVSIPTLRGNAERLRQCGLTVKDLSDVELLGVMRAAFCDFGVCDYWTSIIGNGCEFEDGCFASFVTQITELQKKRGGRRSLLMSKSNRGHNNNFQIENKIDIAPEFFCSKNLRKVMLKS